MGIKSKKENNDELNINRWTLIFNDKLIEANYRYEYYKKSIVSFRISFILVAALYALFGVLDIYTSEEYVQAFFTIRYLIVVPLLLIVWILSFFPKFKDHWQILIFICYVVGGSGIAIMLLQNPSNLMYYGGLFLIFIAGYFFIKLHFLWASSAGLIVVLFYSIASVFMISPHYNLEYFLISNTFFISANIIAMVSIYNSQLIERTEFHQRAKLFDQKEKIKNINESLEGKVKERTELIENRNKELREEIENRKQIEEKLIVSKQKAEESDRLKSSFLSNMSHEIRTPMNGIIGFLEMVTDPDISKDEQEQYIEIVKQSGNRLLQTINDIVEISKIESGELTKNMSEVDLRKTFEYISEFFAPDLSNKNITLSIPEIQEEFIIKTDSNKLESILLNLIKNAIKFSDQGCIEIGIKIKGKQLEFFVKDKGKGIPEERHEAIFDRFVQADLDLTRGHEGTGLGLSISKAYVEYLGGNIWLESEINKGSTFYFTIEYMPVSIPKFANKESAPISLGTNMQHKITALVAEDDFVSFSLMNTILQNENINVIHAKNGKEAVELFEEAAGLISVIFMDVKMPVMNGIEATRKIRELDKNITIIAQTAFALSGDKEVAMDAGCTDYLSKPIRRQDLLAALEHVYQTQM
jgi:signal transduction histidine kinase/CheY-like chemotaxis protein